MKNESIVQINNIHTTFNETIAQLNRAATKPQRLFNNKQSPLLFVLHYSIPNAVQILYRHAIVLAI